MIAFLIKRLMHAILVMFVISVLAFAIQDNLGDPVQQMVGQSVPESEREAIRERLGLNDPFLVQYVRFAKNAVQGDFGYSYFYREPALEVIARHLPATLKSWDITPGYQDIHNITSSVVVFLFGAFRYAPRACGTPAG